MPIIVGKKNPRVYGGVDTINKPQSVEQVPAEEQNDGLKNIHEVAEEKKSGALAEAPTEENTETPVEEKTEETAETTEEQTEEAVENPAEETPTEAVEENTETPVEETPTETPAEEPKKPSRGRNPKE